MAKKWVCSCTLCFLPGWESGSFVSAIAEFYGIREEAAKEWLRSYLSQFERRTSGCVREGRQAGGRWPCGFLVLINMGIGSWPELSMGFGQGCPRLGESD